ncbi:DUF1941-domain-containing protein [Hypomontagnella monticulosa]|nr:DUF1941-domain-containing protein [Hypomontagnella monticulosa]
MDIPNVSKLQVNSENGKGSDATVAPSIDKIKGLLKAKDDTSRFVGLALLKSVLDNSPELQSDTGVIISLWDSISPKFLGRLLRTGSQSASEQKHSRDMLDLAVAVIHTFAVLLPDEAKEDTKLVAQIPRLAQAVLHSSKETAQVIIETLLTLVAVPGGAESFAKLEVEDWTPLIEIAPENSYVLTIFIWAWEKGTLNILEDKQAREAMRSKIDGGIQSFVSSFIGTDATTLLEFIAHILRNLDESLIPLNPKWIGSVTKFIQNLSTNRPTAASRSAYINCAGALLLIYPESTPQLLFLYEKDSSKPFPYLFINLILVDLRATLPSLLEKLNDPEYPQISQRLTSALDILTAFTSQLIAWIDDLEPETHPANSWLKMHPDFVLKLSSSIAETLSVVMEYLRDRWDASVAGAQGLHPEARAGNAHTEFGSRKTLAWDAKDEGAATDAFILSAIHSIALWVRDDDDDMMREKAAGLMDMFMELYQSSGSVSTQPNGLDFRPPVLAALQGILRVSKGIEAFDSYDGWSILSADMLKILEESSTSVGLEEADAIRGSLVALALQTVVEGEENTPEDRMDIVTKVAAYDVPAVDDSVRDEAILEFLVDVLQFVTALLMNASPTTRKRYVHSVGAIRGVAGQLRVRASQGSTTARELEDILSTLAV